MVLLTPSVLSCSISPTTSSYTSLFTRTRNQKKAQEKRQSLYCDDNSNSSLEYLLLSKDQSVLDYRRAPPLPRRQSWGLLSFRSFAKQSHEGKNQRAFYLLAAATNAPLGSSAKSGNIVKMSSSFPRSEDGLFGATNQVGAQGERRRSFGIGGAGNIRRPSEVIYPPHERRRSSVWSGTSGSPDEKKGMFAGWFGFASRSGSRSEMEKK
ncbi:hypothetical protein CJF31_00011251 [Rutstroemia sp. NJR-2017a BVV2]|nr:hypothetical protein CJF31_00011251 [Rutstroemia sp. NJR-2017a BVV2]